MSFTDKSIEDVIDGLAKEALALSQISEPHETSTSYKKTVVVTALTKAIALTVYKPSSVDEILDISTPKCRFEESKFWVDKAERSEALSVVTHVDKILSYSAQK